MQQPPPHARILSKYPKFAHITSTPLFYYLSNQQLANMYPDFAKDFQQQQRKQYIKKARPMSNIPYTAPYIADNMDNQDFDNLATIIKKTINSQSSQQQVKQHARKRLAQLNKMRENVQEFRRAKQQQAIQPRVKRRAQQQAIQQRPKKRQPRFIPRAVLLKKTQLQRNALQQPPLRALQQPYRGAQAQFDEQFLNNFVQAQQAAMRQAAQQKAKRQTEQQKARRQQEQQKAKRQQEKQILDLFPNYGV